MERADYRKLILHIRCPCTVIQSMVWILQGKDRQINRKTDRQTEKATETTRQTDRERETERESDRERATEREADRTITLSYQASQQLDQQFDVAAPSPFLTLSLQPSLPRLNPVILSALFAYPRGKYCVCAT